MLQDLRSRGRTPPPEKDSAFGIATPMGAFNLGNGAMKQAAPQSKRAKAWRVAPSLASLGAVTAWRPAPLGLLNPRGTPI